MSANVGYATVTILPSAKGFASALGKDVNPAAQQSGSKASKSFSSGFGSAIGSVTKIATGAVAVVGGAIAGMSIKGGIARQLQIEDAQAKLLGLGNSADTVKAIMDNALASVKGTAFGLGEAATVAASAVAAGIQPGAQLEGVLKTVADTATIAGASMSDMGLIFGSVAARGKLQGDDLMQLQSRGVPVLQFLAKHYGITAQAASDMVSKGEVDFANFNAAMQENLGGAALKSGNTTRGAFANMTAAFSRFGVVLTPGLALAKTVFGAITTAVDALTAALTPLSGAINDAIMSKVPAITAMGDKAAAAFTKMGDAVKGLASGGLGQLGTMLSNLANVAGPALAAFGGPLLGMLPKIGPSLAGLTGPIGLIISLFTQMLAQSPGLRAALGQLFGVLGQLASTIGAQLGPVLTTVGQVIGQLAGALGDLLGKALVAIMPLIQQLVPPITQLVGAVVALATPLINALMPVLTPIFQLLTDLLTPILALVSPLIDLLAPAISTVASWLTTLSTFLTDVFTGNWTGAWQTIMSSWQPVVQFILDGARNIQSFFQGVITFFTNVFTGNWTAAWGQIRDFAVNAFNGIKNGINAVIGWLGGIGQSILNTLMNSFGGVASWLLQVGRDLINGLIKGIQQVAAGIADVVLGPIKGAVNAVKSFLGIHSPSRLFMQIGAFTGEGMALGLESKAARIADASSALVPTMPDISSSDVGLSIASAAAARNDGEGGDSLTLNYTQVGGQGLTAEQELRRAAQRLKTQQLRKR